MILEDWRIPDSTECVWGCGRSNFSAEHVIGRQFAKRMDLPHPLVLRWATYGREQRKLEIVLRDRVCQRCNSRWMKKLDDHTREVMGPSITKAAPVTISSAAARIKLARWALKVGLLLSLWFHDEAVRDPNLIKTTASMHPSRPASLPYVPLDEFAAVRLEKAPSQRAMVWFGAAGASIPDFFMVSNGLTIRQAPNERAGYSALFNLKELTVFVVVPASDHREDIAAALGTTNSSELHPDILVPVWPCAGPIKWPPSRNVETADAERLIGASADWAATTPATLGTWRPGHIAGTVR
jgi:hypothetical protein